MTQTLAKTDTPPQVALDAMLEARALAATDPAAGWDELERLLEHQWPDGMVPHLVYHAPSQDFPPDTLWVTGRPVTTSGLTAPPFAATALLALHRAAPDDARARALMAVVDRWHGWFGTHRDPEGEGLAAILHPWESGRPTSTDWEDAFETVPVEGVAPYLPDHEVTSANRPQARAVWLIERFRSLGWEGVDLHDGSPFCVIDPGLNAVLIRASDDLAELADLLGDTETAAMNHDRAEKGREAMARLAQGGRYLPMNRVTGRLIQSASVGTVLPAWAGLPVAAEAQGTPEPWAAALVAESHLPPRRD